MTAAGRSPLLSPAAILAVALSLSIGWGIRGNFGHEYGAMIPGALAAIAACTLSGREDWLRRAPYFGMFGALGWAFGGSISYMQVIAYTHSGHAPSQFYGFFCLWVTGFLWAGLGGAGTALPAIMEQRRLIQLFVPLAWVFAAWFVLTVFFQPAIEQWESDNARTWSRHESPFYWFDADWMQALTALVALAAYDLWDRRKLPLPTSLLAGLSAAALGITRFIGMGGLTSCAALVCVVTALMIVSLAPVVPVALYALGGAALGWLLQWGAQAIGISTFLASLLVWPQGDLHQMEELARQQGVPLEEVMRHALINWPQYFAHYPQHIGWSVGLALGVALCFARHGRFSRDASLFVAMGCGWFLCFLLFPTLLSFGGAGFRMTPPRGDDWAGILGVFLGAMGWLFRSGHLPVMYAAIVSGAVGGLGFSGATCLKLIMMAPGNPAITTNPATIAAWQHWQEANWHSFLEQSYGFINGIGVALALGWLASRTAPREDAQQHSSTRPVAVAFVLFGVLYLNMMKNVPEWVERKLVEAEMQAPLGRLVLPAQGWFLLIFLLVALCGTWLMFRHQRRPIALVPETPLGKAQWFYLAFLWSVVVMNLERALPGFVGQRLLTEGTITANAALATCLLLVLPSPLQRPLDLAGDFEFRPAIARACKAAAAAAIIATLGLTVTVRLVYGDNHAGHSTLMKRFGPDATWRITPLLKGGKHS